MCQEHMHVIQGEEGDSGKTQNRKQDKSSSLGSETGLGEVETQQALSFQFKNTLELWASYV